ncbi:SseB family protein [Streptomyces sp. NPDC049577]|uniref:SseB family protein n=1 Tax=Streptomyces sp. NPDC049577 TaxID=3155153 RepID=UPI003445DBE5
MAEQTPHRAASALAREVAALHEGRGRPAAVVGEFRRAAVLVPLDERGGLWTTAHGDVWWIHAFTDEAALARFAVARADGSGTPRPDWEYVSVLGARLLDVVVPAIGEPAGVALDVGGDAPFFLPPVAGVVPEAAALNTVVDEPQGEAQ